MQSRDFQLGNSSLPGLQAVRAESKRSFVRHSHDLFGIGVIDSGGQRSASGRGPVQALRGDVITVNPGEVHDGIALHGVARAWRMLYFEPALLADDGQRLEWTQPALHDPALRMSFNHLYAAVRRGDDALALEQGLAALLQCAPGTWLPERLACVAPLALERARERIADDVTDAPGLAELAREAGLSRYQFLRAFAKAFGLPPHAWLQQRRLACACRSIAQGRALIDAAAEAGFSDQSHMTRLFVRCLGFTPGAYAVAQRTPPES